MATVSMDKPEKIVFGCAAALIVVFALCGLAGILFDWIWLFPEVLALPVIGSLMLLIDAIVREFWRKQG